MFQLLSLSVTCKKNCKVFLPITYLGLSIQILQYLAPPLASEAGVPGVVSSARATSSESSASSRRTSSSTLRPLIEVSASMEAAVPIYLGIFDTYLEGATGGVINKIPIICNGYSKSGRTGKCWNIQTSKEIATISEERGYAASIILSRNEKQKVNNSEKLILVIF